MLLAGDAIASPPASSPSQRPIREFGYRVDANDRVAWVSDDWLEFATENAVDPLDADAVIGRSLFDFVIGRETRQLYRHLFAHVREGNGSVRVPFRCDGPGVRRFMRLRIAATEPQSLDLVAELLREERRDPVALLDPGEPRSAELLTVCSWCRRVRVEPKQWFEVEAAIEALDLFRGTQVPRLTHGMCPDCFAEASGAAGWFH